MTTILLFRRDLMVFPTKITRTMLIMQNKHLIDIFTGVYTKNPFPDIIKSNEGKTFDAYIISNQEIISSLKRLHIK